MAQVCGPTEFTLRITNVPKGYNILRIGTILQTYLGVEDSITSICLKKSISTQQTDSVEVTLCDQKDANLLLQLAKLSIMFNSQEHLLVITKARLKKSQICDNCRAKMGETDTSEDVVMKIGSNDQEIEEKMDVDGDEPLKSGKEETDGLESTKTYKQEFNEPFEPKVWKYMLYSDDLLDYFNDLFKNIVWVSRESASDFNDQPLSYTLVFTSLSDEIEKEQLKIIGEHATKKFSADFPTRLFVDSSDAISFLVDRSELTNPKYWKAKEIYPIFFENQANDGILVTAKNEDIDIVVAELNRSASAFLAEKESHSDRTSAADTRFEPSSSQSMMPFEMRINLPHDSKIMEYMKTDDLIVQMLNDECKGFLSVYRSEIDNSSSYNLNFLLSRNEMQTMSQSQFQSYCHQSLASFLAKFSTRQRVRSRNELEQFREKHNLSETLEWKVNEEIYKLYFQWNLQEDLSNVLVTGDAGAVKNFIVFFEKEINEFEPKEPATIESAPTSSEKQPDHDIHDTKRWNQLLNTDPDLFTKYKQSCVLARNISTDYGFDEVRNVIEEAVEGAKVKKILRIPDGHLIALEKKSTAENLISIDELMLGENELEFEKKVVPEVDEQVLGIKTRLGADFVSSILESCNELQSRFKVLEMSSKRLLVVFENRKSDLLKLIDEMENQKRDSKLQAMRLCYSDRVVVKNVDRNEEDRIKLKAHKKGYFITHSAFNEKDQDLHLFLSDFKDVPKLLNDIIKLEQKAFQFQYYLSDIGELSKDQYQSYIATSKTGTGSVKKFYPKKFQSEFSVHDAVMFMILKSKSLLDELHEKLVGLARVKFKDSSTCLSASFSPVNSQKKHVREQKQLEKECIEITDSFFKTFIVERPKQISPILMQRLQEQNFDRNLKLTFIERENMSVLIRWDDKGNKANAHVTGLYSHIDKLFKMYEEGHTIILCSEFDLRLYKACGILETVERKHFVKISKCNESFNLFVEGTKNDLSAAEAMLETERKEIQTLSDFGFLREPQQKFLFHPSNVEAKEAKFEKLFSTKKFLVFLQLKGSPKLYHKSGYQNRSAEEIGLQLRVNDFYLQDDDLELLGENAWKEVDEFVLSSKPLYIERKREAVTLVGLSPDFEKAKEMIQQVLSQTDDKSIVVKMEKPQQRYISQFSHKLDDNELLESIDWNMNSDDGLHLSGKLKFIEPAKEWIKRTAEELQISTSTFNELWKIKYLKSNVGKQTIESLQSKHQCIIMPEATRTKPEKKQDHVKSSTATHSRSARSNPPLSNLSIILPGSNVTVRVVQGNIIEHKVDAIVNTSNEELELRAGGVSGCIERQGGLLIQQEMNAIREKLPRNCLPSGRAVTTSAGNLSNCRKIIHVAGPIWSRYKPSVASGLVKESTKSCLAQADKEKLKSIAIPAISCGVFGGIPDITAKLIVDAVTEYFLEATKTSLSTVDLIELSNYQMVREFSNRLNALNSQRTFNSRNTSSRGAAESNSTRQQPPPRYGGSTDELNVTVEEGSALLCRADVLVNTAGPNFDLTLSKLSKEVTREGGSGVEAACKKNPKFKSEHFRIAGSGYLPFKYIAHLIVPNGSREIRQINLALLEIFKKIDSYELQSIALPAIGTGNASIPVQESVRMIKSAIEMFKQTKPKHLKTIKIVVFESRLMSEFQCLNTHERPSFPQTSTSFRESAPVSSPQESSSTKSKPTLKLIFCSMSQEINKKVIKQVEWKCEAKYSEKMIDEVPMRSDIKSHLEKIETDEGVTIKLKNNQVHVHGLQEDVKKACEKIKNLIDIKIE